MIELGYKMRHHVDGFPARTSSQDRYHRVRTAAFRPFSFGRILAGHLTLHRASCICTFRKVACMSAVIVHIRELLQLNIPRRAESKSRAVQLPLLLCLSTILKVQSLKQPFNRGLFSNTCQYWQLLNDDACYYLRGLKSPIPCPEPEMAESHSAWI